VLDERTDDRRSGDQPNFRSPAGGAVYQSDSRRLSGLYPASERDEGFDGSVSGGLILILLSAVLSPKNHFKLARVRIVNEIHLQRGFLTTFNNTAHPGPHPPVRNAGNILDMRQ
jgi:hypothetical protein